MKLWRYSFLEDVYYVDASKKIVYYFFYAISPKKVGSTEFEVIPVGYSEPFDGGSPVNAQKRAWSYISKQLSEGRFNGKVNILKIVGVCPMSEMANKNLDLFIKGEKVER